MDKYSKKNKFENIKHDIDAVRFHADRYKAGGRDRLALTCYQYIELARLRGQEVD